MRGEEAEKPGETGDKGARWGDPRVRGEREERGTGKTPWAKEQAALGVEGRALRVTGARRRGLGGEGVSQDKGRVPES